MVKRARTKTPLTTSQQLASSIKSARNIMRKDKGLNGDADRLPMLTWIMFLKFLDDLEQVDEAEAVMGGRAYTPLIAAPYRWRDWGTESSEMSGELLIRFVNQEKATRPDGTEEKGLFTYLRQLQSVGDDRRGDTVAAVFRGTLNRMVNGYLLRDVLTQLDKIHFTSTEELHVLSRTYESMLKEMRDASGDAGEFYTPRPVVRFMVEVTDPRLGETVLDPAAGTGGFLVVSYNHLDKQKVTVADYETLQRRSIYGFEPKSLPYLLAQMNLLLHGLHSPNIDPGNALRFKLSDLRESDRFDVILTNPPFGGEEEKGIQHNFPSDKQTDETAMLFLQLIMSRLHHDRPPPARPARAAVVVPNGTLFGDGVCARVKETLLKDFNLHTIVRLPQGVFAPYTDIPANLLFFERGGPTRTIWYYELTPPEGRKKYTKTGPLQYDEFKPVSDWWTNREEGPQAWQLDFAARREEALAQARPHRELADAERASAAALTVRIEKLEAALATDDRDARATVQEQLREIKARQQAHEAAAKAAQARGDALYWPIYNLDVKNPRASQGREHVDPRELVAAMRSGEAEVFCLLGEIEALIAGIGE